jgi:single-strand DNA-binding protein
MAGSLNRVTLVGNLGRDPEIRHLQDGTKVCNLSLATTDRWTDKASGQKRERTEWHRITIWHSGLVDVASRYLAKGSSVLIEGRLETRKWTDQGGQERYSTEVVLRPFDSRLLMLDGRGGGSRRDDEDDGERSYDRGDRYPSTTAPRGGGGRGSFDDLDDEIPF